MNYTIQKILLFAFILSVVTACAVPQRYWPQEDIEAAEYGSKQADKTILVAATETEFKNQLISELKNNLDSTEYYLHFTGLENLQKTNTGEYDKIIIISTCLSWGLEHVVQEFLDQAREKEKIILISTSGDGNWVPKKYAREMDAIATASKMVNIPKILYKVKTNIDEE
jgi:flagellar biosynthesis regulator FlaF